MNVDAIPWGTLLLQAVSLFLLLFGVGLGLIAIWSLLQDRLP
jgi:hypothetical protein